MTIKSRFRAILEALAVRAKQAETEAIPIDSVTETHAAVLAAVIGLGRKEGVSGVARLLGMQQSSITWTVHKLEAMGLLMRIVRKNAKVHSLIVTPEGAAVLARINAVEEYVQESTLAALSLEERVALQVLLGKAAALEWEAEDETLLSSASAREARLPR